MAKFKLNEGYGSHDQSGKTYVAGDVVETVLPLDEMFPGKFSVFVVNIEEKAEEAQKPRRRGRPKKIKDEN